MYYVEVAYAAAYMNLFKTNELRNIPKKEGFVILKNDDTLEFIEKDTDAEISDKKIVAFIERPQKSRHGRAYVVLHGIIKDTSKIGSNPIIF